MPLYTSYSEETQTQIEEFLENTFGWDEDELVAFVERFGEEKFKLYFEEYADMVDDIGVDVVSSFLNHFDIDCVSNCRDAYMGCYEQNWHELELIKRRKSKHDDTIIWESKMAMY